MTKILIFYDSCQKIVVIVFFMEGAKIVIYVNLIQPSEMDFYCLVQNCKFCMTIVKNVILIVSR